VNWYRLKRARIAQCSLQSRNPVEECYIHTTRFISNRWGYIIFNGSLECLDENTQVNIFITKKKNVLVIPGPFWLQSGTRNKYESSVYFLSPVKSQNLKSTVFAPGSNWRAGLTGLPYPMRFVIVDHAKCGFQ